MADKKQNVTQVTPRVRFKKLHPQAQLPEKAHPTDAAYDLYAHFDEDHLEEVNRKFQDTVPYGVTAEGVITLHPGNRMLVPSGLSVQLPPGISTLAGFSGSNDRIYELWVPAVWELQVVPRSGYAIKEGITILNSPGTVDAGYTGEIGVIVYNSGKEPVTIKSGERICQIKYKLSFQPEQLFVENLDDSARGDSGFGDSGKS